MFTIRLKSILWYKKLRRFWVVKSYFQSPPATQKHFYSVWMAFFLSFPILFFFVGITKPNRYIRMLSFCCCTSHFSYSISYVCCCKLYITGEVFHNGYMGDVYKWRPIKRREKVGSTKIKRGKEQIIESAWCSTSRKNLGVKVPLASTVELVVVE